MEKTSMVWRLLWLLRTVEESPKGISAAQLGDACEVSVRTVYRHIQILRLAGYPIETSKAGYRVDGRMSLAAINLNLPEAFALMLASEQCVGGKAPFSPTLKEAIQKISAVLPAALRQSMREGQKHVLIDRLSPVDYSRAGDIFDLLDAAVNEYAGLTIKYRSLDDPQARQRPVNPLGIMLVRGLWYLIAHCQERDEPRIFRLDRIADAKRTGETFQPPADFSLDDYMKDAWQVVRGDPVSIKVRFTGRAKRIVLEERRHESQTVLESGDGAALVSFRLGGLRQFASWLIGFGGEAEVVEPKELRELVVEIASAAAEQNRHNMH